MEPQDACEEYRGAGGRSVGDGVMVPMKQIENPMVVDTRWNDWLSNPQPERKGFYNKRSEVFVDEDYALEHAVEAIQDDEYERDTFLEHVAELIYENQDVKEKFLAWFYGTWERTGD